MFSSIPQSVSGSYPGETTARTARTLSTTNDNSLSLSSPLDRDREIEIEKKRCVVKPKAVCIRLIHTGLLGRGTPFQKAVFARARCDGAHDFGRGTVQLTGRAVLVEPIHRTCISRADTGGRA
jgi:hypothetical protein